MASFSDQDILQIWETGQFQHPLDRAISVLGRACPEMERTALVALTIGQRDQLLFRLREQTFGPDLTGIAACPQCGERLEFTVTTAEILGLAGPDDAAVGSGLDLSEEEWELAFRLPDSVDLAAAAETGDMETGRALLAQRCVLSVSRNGASASVGELPDAIIGKLAAHMAELDPIADVQLDFDCLSCGAAWQQDFDIVSFFWAEMAARAKRLMHEVHALARAYGWREGDILSMGTARRRHYLEMVEE